MTIPAVTSKHSPAANKNEGGCQDLELISTWSENIAKCVLEAGKDRSFDSTYKSRHKPRKRKEKRASSTWSLT